MNNGEKRDVRSIKRRDGKATIHHIATLFRRRRKIYATPNEDEYKPVREPNKIKESNPNCRYSVEELSPPNPNSEC